MQAVGILAVLHPDDGGDEQCDAGDGEQAGGAQSLVLYGKGAVKFTFLRTGNEASSVLFGVAFVVVEGVRLRRGGSGYRHDPGYGGQPCWTEGLEKGPLCTYGRAIWLFGLAIRGGQGYLSWDLRPAIAGTWSTAVPTPPKKPANLHGTGMPRSAIIRSADRTAAHSVGGRNGTETWPGFLVGHGGSGALLGPDGRGVLAAAGQ